MAQLVKNPPSVRETWIQSLGWEDTLEKGMATHSNILAWRIPWTWGCKESDATEQPSLQYGVSLSPQEAVINSAHYTNVHLKIEATS